MADTTRDIELRLRARDLSTAELKHVIASVNELSGSLDKQLAAATRLELKERELKSTLQQFDQAARAVTGLTALIERTKLLSDQVTKNQADLDKAAEALRRHQAAMEAGTATGRNAERSLTGYEKALKSAQAALDRNSKTLADYHTQLTAAGVEAKNLAAAEQQLVTTATAIGDARTKLNNTIREIPKLEREAREATKASAIASAQAAEAAKIEAAARRDALTSLRAQVDGALIAFNRRHDAMAKQVAEEKRLAELSKRLLKEKHEDETRQARATTDALRNEFRRRIEQQRRDEEAAAAQQQQQRTRGQPAAATPARPGARGQAQTPGFLGLRPYELTNLGYQVNDVISGLASGQNVTQILAQQGGQFIQIFGAAALRWFPLVAAAAAAAAVAIGGLTHNLREATATREFSALMDVNTQSAKYNVEAMKALAKSLLDVGVSWDDSVKTVKMAQAANVLPEAMETMTRLARNLARVHGKEVPDAMKELIEGFSGGEKALQELLGKYPALEDATKRRVAALLNEGRVAEAQALALKGLNDKYKESADKFISPLTRASEDLKKAWDDLLTSIGKSRVFSDLATSLVNFVEGMKSVVESLDSLAKKMDDPKVQFALKAVGAWWQIITAPTRIAGNLVGKAVDAATPYVSAGVGAVQKMVEGTPDVRVPGAPSTSPSATSAEPGAMASRFQKDLQDMVADAASKGIVIGLGRASRSFEEQTDIWNKAVAEHGANASKYAARPGSSSHEFALANDLRDAQGRAIRPGSAEDAYLRANIDRFNMQRRMGHEPWHVEPQGAREAIAAGAPRAGAVGPIGQTDTQLTALNNAARARKEELAILKATSVEEELQIMRTQARRKIIDETGVAEKGSAEEAKQNQLVLDDVEKQRYTRQREKFQQDQEDDKQRVQDGVNADRIAIAGEKAKAAARKEGIVDFETLRSIQKKGEGEERAEIQKRITETDQLDAATKRVDALQRENLKDRKSALDKITEAINLQYDAEIKALEKLRERASQVDKERYDAQIKRLEAQRGVAIGRAGRDAAEEQAKEALATRQDLIQTYTKLESVGEITITEKEKGIKEAFDLTRQSILDAAAALEKFIAAHKELPADQVARLTARVKELRAETKYIDPFWKGLKDTFTQSFSTGMETAFNTVAEAIGGAIAKTKEWKDVWTSVKNAAMNFFAQLLKDLAGYILKAQAAKLASALGFGDSKGGIGGIFEKLLGLGGKATSAAGTIGTTATGAATELGSFSTIGGAVLFKKGGIVGRDGEPTSRGGDASWWNGAPRYRSGSLIGISPDEQRAILHRGEEVLSADNPRNIMNGGGRGGPVSIRNILVDDKRKIAEAMAGAHGERVIIQAVIRNGSTIRELVRG